MDGTGLLAVAGLIVALAIMAGLWVWLRRSRTSGLETVPSTAAATLRVPGARQARSDHDADSGSPRQGSSGRMAPDSPTGFPAAIPAEPEVAGSTAAEPNQALGRDEALPQSGVPEVAPQPPDPGFPVPSASPPPIEEEAEPVPPCDADETSGPDPILPPAGGGPPVLETASQAVATTTGGNVAREDTVTAHRDGVAPLLHSYGTPDALSDPSQADAENLDDRPQASTEDQPDTDQQAQPCVGPDVGAAGLLSSSADAAEPGSATEVKAQPGRDPALPPALETPAGPALRRKQPAVHRDRRGKRRAVAKAPQPIPFAPRFSARPPAEAKLRLSLHPIRRTARLSVVLTRPEGFPAHVTILEAGRDTVEAYDEQRYDDLDLPWTSEFLDGELRLTSSDGFQWLRSARQVHIFVQDPNEPELISTSVARAGIAHTLICRSDDAEAVRLAAAAAGSPELQPHEHWQGIPEGWLVLSGYTPVHAAAWPISAGLRTMDPGEGLEISFEGGLAVRGRVYAAGYPPRIIVTPAPSAASVTIGGIAAELSSDGVWTAPGWDRPGLHMVDIVPGPSMSYEIAADPWLADGWDFWDAHPQRFGNDAREPWAVARICGALIRGPADETVLAAETQPTLVALGAGAGATPLRRRADAAVAVGLVPEVPAFLVSATGRRRSQGRVIWLGLAPAQNPSRRYDVEWIAMVRRAAARRLPLVQADAPGEAAWRKAKERARRLRNRRPRP